jgi:aminopeptidase N
VAPNLTRAEAGERAALVTVLSCRVDLDLTGGDEWFGSRTVLRFRCAVPGAGTFVNLAGAVAERITLNGVPVPVSAFDGERIMVSGLAAENVLGVDARCGYSRSGQGLHRFADPADGNVYLYTNLETSSAQRVYACFDQPDMKAPFELSVTAPPGWQVISNMAPHPRTGTGADADGADAGAGGGCRWRFPATPPVPAYITHVSAGPYHVVRDEHDGIPLGLFCRQSLARYLDAGEIFATTRQGLDFFGALFGIRYPFGKYDQLFVPEFGAAMENAGAVTFLEDYLFRSRVTDSARETRAKTMLHEMAHMWFGNLVTMRWWDDLWLNESFATWAGTLAQDEATRWDTAWTTFAQGFKAWAYRQDQLPSTHPVAADIPDTDAVEVNFDGITYAKGAAVLKQLVAWTGRDSFLAGVRAYFTAHAWGNAALADLLTALETTSGRDLGAGSRQWLQTAGVNTLRPAYTLDAAGRLASFEIRQEAPAAHPVLRSHRITIGLYTLDNGILARTGQAGADITGPATPVPALDGIPRPDLILVNDDDLTYAKIRLDDHSLATLVSCAARFADPLPAALCWAAAWDMCRDAEIPARDYLTLVMTGLPAVTGISLVQALLRGTGIAARDFTAPARRGTALEYLARSLRDLTRSAAPGSDTQLAFLRACTAAATTPADLDWLTALLDGTQELDGLPVDTDLRWTLLTRLVSRGRAAGPEITAELTRDPTGTGERNAATCRAAIPAPAAKHAAWQALTTGNLPLATFRAVLTGFTDPDHPELTAPYRDQYFTTLTTAWQHWPAPVAHEFTTTIHQALDRTPGTITATTTYLSTTQPPPALRRLLTEALDDTHRAIRCQQRDHTAE